MPRAFDRRPLPISNDPNLGLEFHPQSVLKQAAGMWQTIIDSILEAAEDLVKELIQKLIGIAVDPEQALDELWDLLTGWVGDIPVIGDILAKINEVLSPLFGGIDFTDLPSPEEVWEAVMSAFVAPLDIFASLVGGLIPGSQIPGLDASKITSGSFAQTMVANLTTDLGTATTNAGNALTKAQGWLDGFFKGITGDTSAGNVSVAEAQAKAAEISETQAAQSAMIAELQNKFDSGEFQGVSWFDGFDRTQTNIVDGTIWAGTKIQDDGGSLDCYLTLGDGEAKPVDNSTFNFAMRYRCVDSVGAVTHTSYQKITWTCGSTSPQGPNGASSQQNIRLYFRMNTAETQYGFVEIGGNNLAQWGYKNGGAETMVGSAFACNLPSAGTKFTLVIGTNSGIRYYQLWRNANLVNQWNDSGTGGGTAALVAENSTNNTGWGFGCKWGEWFFPGSDGLVSPPSVSSVSISDNLPAAVPGTTAKMSRTSTSGVSSSSTGSAGNASLTNVFDTLDYNSNDLGGANYSLTNARFTIPKTGTYIVNLRTQLSTGLGNTDANSVIYKNGTICGEGLRLYQGTFGGGLGTDCLINTWLVQLQAGDTISAGRRNNATISIVGGGSGALTYFTIARVT